MKLPTHRKSIAFGTTVNSDKIKWELKVLLKCTDCAGNISKTREQEININISVTMKGTLLKMQLSRKSLKKRIIQKSIFEYKMQLIQTGNKS